MNSLSSLAIWAVFLMYYCMIYFMRCTFHTLAMNDWAVLNSARGAHWVKHFCFCSLDNVALCFLPICCKSIEKQFPWWLFVFCDDYSLLACSLQIFLCWNIFTLHYFWFTLQGCTRYQSHLIINWLSTNQMRHSKAIQDSTVHFSLRTV